MQSLDIEIRRHLADYLAGTASRAQFEDWFVPAVWDIEQSGNILAAELAHEIQLRLAELSNGHWTEDEFSALLRPLVESYETAVAVDAALPALQTRTGSDTQAMRSRWIAGMSPEMAFG